MGRLFLQPLMEREHLLKKPNRWLKSIEMAEYNIKKPRMRMFAGPNGSGKSTLKSVIPDDLIGVYINPDEIEKEIAQFDFLDLQAYGVDATEEEVQTFFNQSTLLEKADLLDEASFLKFDGDKVSFFEVSVNAYFASVCADFLRRKLLEKRISFTFETVMSAPDKIEILKAAQELGYRTYLQGTSKNLVVSPNLCFSPLTSLDEKCNSLAIPHFITPCHERKSTAFDSHEAFRGALYYIATDDVSINMTRIKQRVIAGGHDVPQDKVVSRYHRSLNQLPQAINASNRAYIFDNSGAASVWVCEIIEGEQIEYKQESVPDWVYRHVVKSVVS